MGWSGPRNKRFSSSGLTVKQKLVPTLSVPLESCEVHIDVNMQKEGYSPPFQTYSEVFIVNFSS